MSEHIQLEINAGGIAILTFNRPQARNALTWAMQHSFRAQIQALIQNPTVRVLILTGAGDRAFCAGGDLVELAAFGSQEDGGRVAAVMGEALAQLEAAPFPVIAAINGYALGGGSEIALACDLRIADENAQMGLVQLSLGLTPGWGAGQRLLRVVGYSRALWLLLQAQPMTAALLLELHLIDQVVSAGTALSAALSFAQHIARHDQAAVQAVKRLLRAGLTLPYAAAQQAENREFPPLWAAEAHLKAVENFLAKKAAKKDQE
jgi:enoyl-CoA hydratase